MGRRECKVVYVNIGKFLELDVPLNYWKSPDREMSHTFT